MFGLPARPALPARRRHRVAVAAAGAPPRAARAARTAVLSAAALACAVAPARPQAPLPIPPVLGHESVAAAEGAPAALFNPAALGSRYPAEALFWSTQVPGRASDWGGILMRGGAALHGRRLAPGVQEWGLAAGWGRERERSGLGVTWRVDTETRDFVADLAFGTRARPAPWLSAGLLAEHLAEPAFRGARLPRTYTAGLALRPLALARPLAHGWGTRLTVTADVLWVEGAGRGEALGRFGAEFEPVPGIVLRGAVDGARGVRVGLGLLGVRTALHGHAARVDGARASETWALSAHEGEDRTVLAPAAARRVGTLRLAGRLADEAIAEVSLFGASRSVAVGPLHRALAGALEDPLTRGVLLELGGLSGMAHVEELRPRIARLRAAGKPVVAYLETGGGRADLYLAAACDRIVASEEALFTALGLSADQRSYRPFLARLGVRVDRASIGDYKSANRELSRDSVGAADREALDHTLDVLQETFVATFAADRGVARERVLAALDGRAWSSAQLAALGVVDSVGYREDALRVLGRLAGLGARPRTARLARLVPAARAWTLPGRVAVVYASGEIVNGRSGAGLLADATLGAETLAAQLERAFKHREVRAVVLRVESPGGYVTASNLMRHAAERWKRETGKPLVVSMGRVAASGGYYLATPADRILANRFTATGSIGVVALRPSLEGLFERQGIRQDFFDRGEYMGGWSLGRDWEPRHQAAADSFVARSYEVFLDKVAAGRRLPLERVREAAQGRLWYGEDARARGLVDAIGGLEDAIGEARRLAGIPAGERIRPLEFRRPRPGFVDRLIGDALIGAWARLTAPLAAGGPMYLAEGVPGD